MAQDKRDGQTVRITYWKGLGVSAATEKRIIIVGGGVIELSTAYNLAKLGDASVLLLEKQAVGDGSSSRAGGIVTGHLWTETGVEARKISLRLYRELSEELDAYGYQYQAVGCLNLFSPEDWPERAALLPLYGTCDVPYEIIDAGEIRYRWPELAPAEDAIGLYDPLGGYSEPDEYVPALAQRCRDLGVDIREGVTVTGFVKEGNRITGVSAGGELIDADLVICTLHSWTNRLLAEVGKQLPIKSFVHQRYLTEPLRQTAKLPAVNANPYEAYLRPASGNRILVGGETPERAELGTPPLAFRMGQFSAPNGFSDSLRDKVKPLLPLLDQHTFTDEKVGLISFSMDGEPILGQCPNCRVCWLAPPFIPEVLDTIRSPACCLRNWRRQARPSWISRPSHQRALTLRL